MIDTASIDNQHAAQSGTADIIAKVQSRMIEQFETELDETRAAMAAMVAELTATADRERTQAAAAAAALDAMRRELEQVREECRVEVEHIRQSALKYRDETVAWYETEVNAARELAKAAADAEARVREELAATNARNQEIVDAQMLRIVELKRQLDLASATAVARSTVPAEPVRRAPVQADVPSHDPNRHRRPPEFAEIEAALAGSPPVPVSWERIA